jgi:amino acid transporter
LAFVVLFKHGLTVDTNQLKLKGLHFHGLSLGVVVCIFSLVGFESATALGGEARRPLRNVPRAVIWSLLLTGLFFVVISYVEVYGTRHSSTPLGSITAPLNTISQLYGVSSFKIPLSLGAMVSFFSLTLSCLNAGARILFPMAHHSVFPKKLGAAHPTNGTPHVAIAVYISFMVATAAVLEIVTNPLTIFGDAGTLAAFGFLLAYFLVTVAAPVYLSKLGQLRPINVVVAVVGFLCLLVPTIGSFYPVPPFPTDIFPYIYLTFMLIGAGWLWTLSRRRPGLLTGIEADLEFTLQESRSAHPDIVLADVAPA